MSDAATLPPGDPLRPARYRHEPYRELAADLVEAFADELADVPPLHTIAFIRDDEAEPKTKGRPKLAQVRRVPAALQVLTEPVEWLVEVFTANHGEGLTQEQLQVLMYHELRHFRYTEDGGYSLQDHDVAEFSEILATLGAHWTSPFRAVPDILAEGFRWQLPPVQGRLVMEALADAPGRDDAH